MSYFSILAIFVAPPMMIFAIAASGDLLRWVMRRQGGVNWLPYRVIVIHVALALVYTTPWDNYLVATGVWWYDPSLVTGLTIGWVPVEEYTFFVLMTLLTGFWTLNLSRTSPSLPVTQDRRRLRLASSLIVGALWVGSTVLLLSGWQPGAYLTLILSWALIPIFVQLIFGADILWASRRPLAWAILAPTLYLWCVDYLALSFGTWVIDPAQTTGLKLGILPLEEMLFFAIVNVIIAFGVTLMISPASRSRAVDWFALGQNIINKFQPRAKIESSPKPHAPLLWMGAMILWIAVLIATPISLWLFGENAFPWFASSGVLAHLAVALVSLHYGWPARRIGSTLIALVVFTWAIEWVGSHTGFPFGAYAYSPALQPQLLGVPVIIPLAWGMMLIPAWAVAESILMPYRERLASWYRIVFAALAGLVFTAWDLYLDPQMTARGLWSWQSPGGYFGIPWQNYLGWWFSSSLITGILQPARLPRAFLIPVYGVTWWMQAIGLGLFWGQPGPALVGFLAMGGFFIWAVNSERGIWRSWSGLWRAYAPVSSRSR